MGAREVVERLTGAQRVFGEPYTKDDITVIPAVSVRAGGGFGTGKTENDEGEGGGVGLTTHPVGAYVIRDGEVRWEPAIDVNRIVVGGQILTGILFLMIYTFIRRHRRK